MDNMNDFTTDQLTGPDIAVIGMAGRFPGARNVNDFWENLRAGVESIRFASMFKRPTLHHAIEHSGGQCPRTSSS